MSSGDQLTAKTDGGRRKRRLRFRGLFGHRSDLRPHNAEIRLASEAAALSPRRRQLARKRAEYEHAIAKAVRMIAEAERVEADARARIAAHELAANMRDPESA